MSQIGPCIALVCVLISPPASAGELLFPNSDFETGTLAGWTAAGEAFQTQPTKGDNTSARGREPANMQGTWWIGGYEKYNGQVGRPGATAGDKLTGTLTSREFTVSKPYITFRIGAGNLPDEVGVRLLCEGQQVLLASGVNDETMVVCSADVTKYIGKQARLEVFDQATGGWGHINVDDFRASDTLVGVSADRVATAGLETYSSYLDVGYDQPYRPQFHFTSRKNWLNDPNGLVYYDGEYHMFFQHNPKGIKWGNMTWGHAVSTDMVHWQQLPHAILPYDGGTIFSGTAVVDHNNSLGVQHRDTKTLVAAFTFARQPFYQALAYSTDRGRTFTLWNEGRPVVPNQGFDVAERDPKVFWHEASQKWVMVLWVLRGQPGRVLFFVSDDLQTWQETAAFQRDWVYECMDLVRLPVDGDANNPKWVIYDASFDYEVGDFDGRELITDKIALRGEYGPNYYAAQSFNNSPDDRTVMIGWMRGGDAAFVAEMMPFNQQMSFPTTIQLKTTPEGVRLFRWPIQEIEKLYDGRVAITDGNLRDAQSALAGFRAELADFSIEFAATSETQLTIDLRGQQVEYRDGAFFYQESKIPARPVDGTVLLRALVDRASVELFAAGGAAVGTFYAKLDGENHSFSVTSDRNVEVKSLSAHRLKSIWPQ